MIGCGVRGALLSFLACAAIGAAGARAGGFNQVVGFGDSLTDVHNLYVATGGLLPPSPPYFDGRLSNGPLWIEHLATYLGLPTVKANLDGGLDYAYAGAKSGSGFTSLFIPNLLKQVDNYLTLHTPAPDDLIVIWAGANDLLDGVSDVGGPVANVASAVETLAAAGGRQFLVANLPPLGKTPDHVGMPEEEMLDQQSVAFNQLLSLALDGLEASLNVDIHRLDAFNLYEVLLTDPAAYGFTNTMDPAVNENGEVVPDPSGYLFWDGIHPTAEAHALLGQAAVLAVPEGASAAAFLFSGIAAVVRIRKRRHAA